MRPARGHPRSRAAAVLSVVCVLSAAGIPSIAGVRSIADATSIANAAARTPRSLLSIANSIRSGGCDGHPGVSRSLRARSALDAAAQRLAAGAGLRRATSSVGYRATSSVSIHISGDLSDTAVSRMLSSRFCRELANPALRDFGAYRQGSDLWIIAAAPFATPALSNAAAVERQVLDLVNAARARGHRCGHRSFGPVPPLHLSSRLRAAAIEHSRDMAAHGYLEHTGRDGSTPADRVTRAGYAWRSVGENIAAGPASAREAAAGWLASPEHCANIMDPSFTQTAIAYAINPKSRGGVYWTEEFAAPARKAARRSRR